MNRDFQKTALEHATAGCNIASQLSRACGALKDGEPLGESKKGETGKNAKEKI